MLIRALLLVAFVSAAVAACSEEVDPGAEPECTGVKFRACETDACTGFQQCLSSGRFGPCSCNVTDASYVDVWDGSHVSDGNAGPEASDSADEQAP